MLLAIKFIWQILIIAGLVVLMLALTLANYLYSKKHNIKRPQSECASCPIGACPEHILEKLRESDSDEAQ